MERLLMLFKDGVCKVYIDGKHIMDITKDDKEWLEKNWLKATEVQLLTTGSQSTPQS